MNRRERTLLGTVAHLRERGISALSVKKQVCDHKKAEKRYQLNQTYEVQP